MKSGLLTLFGFFLWLSSVNAQQVLCGYDLVLKNMEGYSLEYQEAVRTTFENAKRGDQGGHRSDEVYTIPVIVHVVWKDEAQNIPDSVILSQIDVLNEDYRHLNADAGNLRPIFEGMVGDPRIEFQLKEIIRVQTDTVFDVGLLTGDLPDHVKSTDEGGSDAVDPESYLNIWVTHIQPITLLNQVIAVILGYAYPPDGLPHWPEGVAAPERGFDGVVIDYRVFGRNPAFSIDIPGLSQPIQTAGRTAVHEVGHYLGLRHVWGDGGGLLGGNSCGEDDGVEDTPNTAGQAMFDCDTLRNTCTDETNDLPDMIENYMDYAAETCMNGFTEGQIRIMRGVLEEARCKLVGTCSAVAISDVNKNDRVLVFPNPSTGTVQFDFNGKNKEDYSLTVLNLWGQRIKTISDLMASEIDLGFLSSGTYLLEFRSDEERMIERVVINGN